jgi:2-oxoglutarate dehydrogenase E2 component (dihydrolipoamide succinyltransferase)
MPVEVVMPQMGESIFEGTVTKWLKKPGDRVERDEPLFEISTDKVDAEIQSPAAGVLREVRVGEGQTVPIRTVVAVIDAEGASPASAAAPVAPAQAAGEIVPPSPAAGSTPAQKPAAGEDDSGPISPLVRRLAREHNVDLSTVRGTGAGGRISKQDVLAAAERKGAQPATVPAAPSPGGPAAPSPGGAPPHTVPHPALESAVPRERIYFGRYQVQPMSVMRKNIAEHMVLSKRVSPHVYSLDEADMTRIIALRDAAKDDFEKRHGLKLTFMPFFARACAEALRAFPTVNASLDGTNIVLHSEINLGIAVALDAGLIVPVLKDAAGKTFVELQRAVTDLAERARTKKLHPDEVHESTFSITNPGVFGGLGGFAAINQPNVAILAIGAIQKRPVVVTESTSPAVTLSPAERVNDAVVARSMVYLTLSYDHRVVDGAVAHQFLSRIKQHLESWNEKIA